jgi:two-component system sensor histidine kinase MtrB
VSTGNGLRRRLVVGFVSVTVATVLVTGAVAVAGVAVLFYNRPDTARTLGRRLYQDTPVSGISGSDLWWLLGGAAAVLLGLSVGTALFVGRRMLRPVQDLAEAAERVAEGDLDVRLQPHGDDELAQLALTFNVMTANLDYSMQTLRHHEAQARRFASDVSHELRTPLAAMTAVTEVLSSETGGMSDDAAQATRLVVQEIGHLTGLVNDLIEMSRFDAGTATLNEDVVNVAAAVHGCLALRGWTDSVVTQVPPQLEGVLDRRRLDVILANLVGNAVKYAAPPITVTADAGPRSDRPHLVLTVTDRGPGLSVDALPYVFDRFYKADAARARSDGSGLGLAIALENARLHGGSIAAENRPGGGAMFTLELPLRMPQHVPGPQDAQPRTLIEQDRPE